MERVILGHPVVTNSRSFIFTLVPALAAVVILGSHIQQPTSHTLAQPAKKAHEIALSSFAPISAAEAHSPVESSVDFFALTDPASTFSQHQGLSFDPPLRLDGASQAIPDSQTSDNQETADTSAQETPESKLESLNVRRGDSLSSLLTQAGIKASDWLAVARLKGDARALHHLQPGDTLDFRRDGDSLLELQLALDKARTLVITRTGETFTQSLLERPVEYRRLQLQASVQSSMYVAALDAGMTDRMIMEFAEIFAWDIDFTRDVREGDSMRVIFDEPHDPQTGEVIGNRRIVAAEYIGANHQSFKAIHYQPESGFEGYFDADGRPLRKAFLRTPVEFARISSRYSRGRKHPILNKVRAHKGVDYAAKHGTPIRATGSGRIAFAGTKGGYGRTVIIKHNEQYKTLYAHMSRYAKGLRNGDRVQQGEIIGYVGSSGLATGPHLHYEFHKNGRHRDPLSVKLPAADPLPKTELARFQLHSSPLLEALAQIGDDAQLAQADISAE